LVPPLQASVIALKHAAAREQVLGARAQKNETCTCFSSSIHPQNSKSRNLMSENFTPSLLGLGAGVASAAPRCASFWHKTPPHFPTPSPRPRPGRRALKAEPLPKRLLGQTGQLVTVFGLGGASARTPLSNGPQEKAVEIIERALALGVGYFDTAVTYGNGRSETALGEVAKTRRKEMFIASKSDARDYDGAMRELEGTLKRLQTDHLDLWQQHRASTVERDTTPFFAENGAHKALRKMKDEKVVRFLGVTGHHRTDVLADWLKRFDFDTLLATVNAVDRHHDVLVHPEPAARGQGAQSRRHRDESPAYGRLLN
jgi:hypothetical protein